MYFERKFKAKVLKRHVVKNPWKSPSHSLIGVFFECPYQHPPCSPVSACAWHSPMNHLFSVVDRNLDESIKCSTSDRLGELVPQVRARTFPGVFHDMALQGFCLELSFNVLYCRTQANPSTLMHFAEPAIWPSSIRTACTEDPTYANHVDVLTVWSVFPSNVHNRTISTSSVVSRVDWKACA